ncbi:MAG: GHKL domain-containing protein [Bacteroidetes bacterium]|nr:MAG: GHKL domain-containing protein [Bacteroidota bacterium]
MGAVHPRRRKHILFHFTREKRMNSGTSVLRPMNRICLIVSLLLLLIPQLPAQNPDSLRQVADRLSREERPGDLLNTYELLNQVYYRARDLEQSLAWSEKGYELAEDLRDVNRQVYFLKHLGIAYMYYKNDYHTAREYFLKAEKVALADSARLALPYKKEIPSIFSRIADTYFSEQIYYDALRYQLRARNMAEMLKDTVGLAFTYRNLGIMYMEIPNPKRGVEYLEKCLQLQKTIKSPDNLSSIYATLARGYLENKQVRMALDAIKMSRQIADSTGYTYGADVARGIEGRVLIDYGEYQAAIDSLSKTLNSFKANPLLTRDIYVMSCDLAKAYLRAGKLEEAGKVLDEAAAITLPEGQELTYQQELYKLQIELYEKTGRVQDAFSVQKKLISLKDSTFSREMQGRFTQFEDMLNAENQAKKIQELENQNFQFQRNALWGALLTGIILVLLGAGLTLNRNRTLRNINELLASKNEEIRLQNERLSSSNEDLRQFAHIAAHDLREPIRTIGGFASLLQRRYEGRLDKEADEFLEYIRGSVLHMNRLLADLLTYSTIGIFEHEYTQVDLGGVITDIAAQIHQDKSASGVRISVYNLPQIRADKRQMRMLFQHLIDNSIKFRSDAPPQIEIKAEERKGEYLISVKDNGIGIDESYTEKIFSLFLRLHPSQSEYGGTGVGLSICRKIVDQHKGKIWIESRLGAGTTVYIRLPRQPVLQPQSLQPA